MIRLSPQDIDAMHDKSIATSPIWVPSGKPRGVKPPRDVKNQARHDRQIGVFPHRRRHGQMPMLDDIERRMR